MPRYIDAETIPDLFDEKFKETQKLIEAGETQLDNLAEGFAEAEKIVLFKASTADVQEVRHGRWKYKILDNFRKVECTCTHCGWSGVDNYDSYVDISDFEYCPYCGAKMDL